MYRSRVNEFLTGARKSNVKIKRCACDNRRFGDKGRFLIRFYSICMYRYRYRKVGIKLFIAKRIKEEKVKENRCIV